MKIFEVLPLIPMMLMTGLSVSPRTEKPPGQPMTNTEDYLRYPTGIASFLIPMTRTAGL